MYGLWLTDIKHCIRKFSFLHVSDIFDPGYLPLGHNDVISLKMAIGAPVLVVPMLAFFITWGPRDLINPGRKSKT